MNVIALLASAYRIPATQVIAPEWTKSEVYDIVAKIPPGSSQDDVDLMMQALLTEKFKVVVHRENRQAQGYALLAHKDGVKLRALESPGTAERMTTTRNSTGNRVLER